MTADDVRHSYRAARDRLFAAPTYAEALATFAWPDVGSRFNWAHDWFDAFARGNQRTGLAIVTGGGGRGDSPRVERTFDELATRSDQVAAWLAARGVRRGDRVVLMLGNRVELWECMLAVMKLGAVILPTTTALPPADLRDRLARASVTHVIADGAVAAKFDDVPGDYGRIRVGAGPDGTLTGLDGWADLDEAYSRPAAPPDHPGTAPGDPLLLYFTSGTTSRPKLVEHTQVSYPVGHLTTAYWLGVRPGDVHLNISSPGWAKHAWSCFFAPWIAEATVFVYDYARFEAAPLLEQIRGSGVTTFCAPPTVWRMLIKADLSGGPGTLREVIAAGEPLNPEVIEQVRKQWGLTLRDGFGQTETTALVGNVPGEPVKPGSMGRPLPGVPFVLVDPLSSRPTDGEGEGEICLDLGAADAARGGTGRPLNLMTGYHGDPDRNADATAAGYYHTGDVASRDADGYITYVGRTDDVFKASDYKVSPFELESVLVEHPAVIEAAVVPAPDPVRQAVPKAYILLAPGFEPSRETALEILKHAREHLAPFLRVRRIEFGELPKTVSGKIRRVELRGRENDLFSAGLSGIDDRPAGEWRDSDFPELTGGASPVARPQPVPGGST